MPASQPLSGGPSSPRPPKTKRRSTAGSKEVESNPKPKKKIKQPDPIYPNRYELGPTVRSKLRPNPKISDRAASIPRSSIGKISNGETSRNQVSFFDGKQICHFTTLLTSWNQQCFDQAPSPEPVAARTSSSRPLSPKAREITNTTASQDEADDEAHVQGTGSRATSAAAVVEEKKVSSRVSFCGG